MDAAQALPGPQLLVLALLQQIGQTARRKLGRIADAHALRPVGKLLIVGAGQRPQQGKVIPPPLLQDLALRGQLHIQHFQQSTFFRIRALLPSGRMPQQRIFLLQYPDVAAVSGQIPGVQLAQCRVQKPAAALRCALDQAQVSGVEHHSGKAAGQTGRPLGGSPVHRGIAAGAGCIRGAHRDAHPGRVIRLLIFLPGALGHGFQHRECLPTAHKFGILAAPEALAAGEQPDGLQQIGLALTVVAADDRQLPAGFQPGRRNVAVIRNFQ